MSSRFHRSALPLLACVALTAACPRPRTRAGRIDTRTCVLVDSDGNLDDFRAITALVGTRRVVGVVATAGVSSAPGAAAAVRHLLARSDIPVIVGEGRLTSDDRRDDWLPGVRAVAESLNGTLSHPGLPRTLSPETAVARWTRGCEHVDVIVLGPWSSFVRYRAALDDTLSELYALGPDPTEVPTGARVSFNCRYDRAACRQAPETVLWVTLPVGASEPFLPTAAMFEALPTTGVAGALRLVFARSPEHWNHYDLADDAVVLRYLSPRDFRQVGHHDEPVITPDALRARWVEAARAAH